MKLRIREIREARGMSQAQLAEAAGYEQPNAISKIENGKVNLNIEKLFEIATALSVPPSALINDGQDAQAEPAHPSIPENLTIPVDDYSVGEPKNNLIGIELGNHEIGKGRYTLTVEQASYLARLLDQASSPALSSRTAQ